MGSGAEGLSSPVEIWLSSLVEIWFPDSTNVRVSTDHAWEHCVYVYDATHFGIYTKDGFKLELPGKGSRKMKVEFSGQSDGHVKVKIPLELIGEPEKLSFVVMTAKPGAGSYNIANACDVAPGGMQAMEGNLITLANDYYAPPKPGTTRTTVTGEGYVYDNAGNVICDLDNDGNIVRKYLYGLGGKHLAMEVPSTQNWTYEDSRLNHQPEVAVVSDPQAVDQSALKATKGNIPLYNCVYYGPYTPDQSAEGLYKVSYVV